MVTKEANVSRQQYVARKDAITKRLQVVETRMQEVAATLRALQAEVAA